MDTSLAFDIVLLPSMQQVCAWRKEAARRRSSASFGCEVSTFQAWIADLWGLYGDGRSFVSRLERSMLFCCDGVVDEDDPARRRSIARVAEACASEASGIAAFEDAVAGSPIALASEEVPVIDAVRAYRERLANQGLIEPGQAIAQLPELLPRKPLRVLLKDCPPLDHVQRAFFDACDWMTLDERPAAGSDGPLRAPDGVTVRFAFPSGAYAWPSMLADVVREEAALAADGTDRACRQELSARVVAAAKDPVGLYDELAPTLSREGITVALRGRRAFVDTDFGRAFFSLARFFGYNPASGAIEAGAVLESPEYPDIPRRNIEPWNRSDLADFMLSALSGIKRKKAYEMDASFRGDRTRTRDVVRAELRVESRVFSLVERLFDDSGDLDAAKELTLAVRSIRGVSEAWIAEQVACAMSVKEVLQVAFRLGMGMDVCLRQLETLSVDVSRAVTPKVHGDASAQKPHAHMSHASDNLVPDLLICDQMAAAALRPKSCATMVVADLTSVAYPAADADTSARTLLAKLGVSRTDTALARMRRAFFALEHLPNRQLILERCLNDFDANPLYPCVVLEEFVDCYRADPTDLDDIDNLFLIPEQLQVGMLARGEETLFSNHVLGSREQEIASRVKRPEIGVISEANRKLVVLPRVIKNQVIEEPCLAPSQIESYLECPYKWFADRRLRLESIDEDFGPLEMGDFAHNALCSFYRHFKEETGLAKVTRESLGEARRIMADVLERHKALQPNLKERENRLIATGELEKRQVEELCEKLMSYLDYEITLLPEFHPEHLEYAVAGEGVVDYAGQKLIGTADRIDVDADGRCVVIDYKGSLSESYSLAQRKEGSLGKVQSLIYAQVVRRTLGYDPVGAIYVCYGRRKFAAGAYDGHVIGETQVPGSKARKCSWPTAVEAPALSRFTDLLDQTEEAVASALERMLAGDVAPRPASAEACKWCPVASCPERKC